MYWYWVLLVAVILQYTAIFNIMGLKKEATSKPIDWLLGLCVFLCLWGSKRCFAVSFTHFYVHSHEGPLFLMEQVHIEVADSPVFFSLFDALRRHCVFRFFAAAKTVSGRCYSLWKTKRKTEGTIHCSFQGVSSPQVFDCCSSCWPCLEHVEEQHFSACVQEPACGACTCMCMNRCCDRKLAMLHVNVSGLHQNVSVFNWSVLLAVSFMISCLVYGQWHAPCHLSHQACLRSLCMGSRLIGTCQSLNCEWSLWGRGRGVPPHPASGFQIPTVVTAGETVLFWFLQDSEGAQPLNLSAKPKASESKSPNSPPTSPQVPAAAAAATKLGHAGSMKHSATPSSIGGPPTRVSSIGKWT